MRVCARASLSFSVSLSFPPSLSHSLYLRVSLLITQMWPNYRACCWGSWPTALLLHSLVALLVCGSADAFTILSPFSYSSLSFKNLLNSVFLSSNANLAGGGRNLKSDVLEDASLITVSTHAALGQTMPGNHNWANHS